VISWRPAWTRSEEKSYDNLAVLVDEDAIFIAIKNFLTEKIRLLSVHRDRARARDA